MNRRYLIWGVSGVVLIILTAVLLPLRTERPVLCPVKALLHPDGSIEFGGQLFQDRSALKDRLVNFRKQNPDCFMSVVADSGTEQKTIENAFESLRGAGFSSVGFLTEPQALSH